LACKAPVSKEFGPVKVKHWFVRECPFPRIPLGLPQKGISPVLCPALVENVEGTSEIKIFGELPRGPLNKSAFPV